MSPWRGKFTYPKCPGFPNHLWLTQRRTRASGRAMCGLGAARKTLSLRARAVGGCRAARSRAARHVRNGWPVQCVSRPVKHERHCVARARSTKRKPNSSKKYLLNYKALAPLGEPFAFWDALAAAAGRHAQIKSSAPRRWSHRGHAEWRTTK
jgi:hypothetical protein